jgi:hypothetical protein
MLNLRAITALVITIACLLNAHVASAFEATYKLPCLISYSRRPPISTNCLATIRMSRGVVAETVQTLNGRTFIIVNNKADMDVWDLDHKQAVKMSDKPITCYQNQEAKISF